MSEKEKWGIAKEMLQDIIDDARKPLGPASFPSLQMIRNSQFAFVLKNIMEKLEEIEEKVICIE